MQALTYARGKFTLIMYIRADVNVREDQITILIPVFEVKFFLFVLLKKRNKNLLKKIISKAHVKKKISNVTYNSSNSRTENSF